MADLQFWLYHYGHTMNPEAPLNTGSFTPKVLGTTKVWNFHSQTGFEIGFYLMLAAAIEITVVPLAAGWWQRRHARTVRPRTKWAPRNRACPSRAGGGVKLLLVLSADRHRDASTGARGRAGRQWRCAVVAAAHRPRGTRGHRHRRRRCLPGAGDHQQTDIACGAQFPRHRRRRSGRRRDHLRR